MPSSPAPTPERLAELRRVRDAFHEQLFNHFLGVNWLGVKTLKCPTDLCVYQEILFEKRPELIIETGSYLGGSALFMASVCDLLGQGRVVSIDVEPAGELPMHPRISWIKGDSVSREVLDLVATERAEARTAMVILDSNHTRGHVLRELKAYASMVSVDQYLIVEDTNVNGHPVLPEHGPGPWEAVGKFLEGQDSFGIDVAREKFLLSFNPGGYLLRVK